MNGLGTKWKVLNAKTGQSEGSKLAVILNQRERSYEVSLMKVDGPDNEN